MPTNGCTATGLGGVEPPWLVHDAEVVIYNKEHIERALGCGWPVKSARDTRSIYFTPLKK